MRQQACTRCCRQRNAELLSKKWRSILKRNTSVTQETITETSDEGPKYTADTFLEGYKAIRFLEEGGYGDRGENAYKEFLKKMVPKTRVLFDLIKKFIEKVENLDLPKRES